MINSMRYSVSFEDGQTQITAPNVNGKRCNKSVTVSGSTDCRELFLCLQGPSGEISVYPLEVHHGYFSKELWLRFGPGTYKIWAGVNEAYFDGSIRFQVENQSQEDYRYLTPSGYIDSDSPEIKKTAASLIKDRLSQLEQVKAIHDYVVSNVSYEYNATMERLTKLNTASSILSAKSGICRDFAFLFTGLNRAAGIPTRVVYGEVLNEVTQAFEQHAWNETYIDNRWISIDPTWNSGYILNDTFICEKSEKYFDMADDLFGKTHTVTTITLF